MSNWLKPVLKRLFREKVSDIFCPTGEFGITLNKKRNMRQEGGNPKVEKVYLNRKIFKLNSVIFNVQWGLACPPPPGTGNFMNVINEEVKGSRDPERALLRL